MSIPVIDLFSGPGGLGEGFVSLDDGKTFRIVGGALRKPGLSRRRDYSLII
jgi:DNA (cytosine-5)-methyltransferase 1